MKHLKYFRKTSPRGEEFINKGWKDAKIGDIQSEDVIYQYVQELHGHDNFGDGDLGDRLEMFQQYQLQEVEIYNLDLQEWDIDEYVVDEYIAKFKESNSYPPIVVDDSYEDYSIIDGTHRANALSELGHKTILAWVGVSE